MAYQGTTAASSVSNPPLQVTQPLSGGGFSTVQSSGINLGSTQIGSSLATLPGRALGLNLWMYASTDPSSTVLASSTYFTDGIQLGMKPGDAIIVISASSLGSSATISLGVVTMQSSAGTGCGSTGSYVSSTR